jgi:hypothetical protein
MITPWLNVGRINALLPVVYAAWWKRSIYVSIAWHGLGNITTSVVTIHRIADKFRRLDRGNR